MIVGGYSLHLYCAVPECHKFGDPSENHQTFTAAMREMTQRGWKRIEQGSDVICPECVKKGITA